MNVSRHPSPLPRWLQMRASYAAIVNRCGQEQVTLLRYKTSSWRLVTRRRHEPKGEGLLRDPAPNCTIEQQGVTPPDFEWADVAHEGARRVGDVFVVSVSAPVFVCVCAYIFARPYLCPTLRARPRV